ncbi:MAG: hypothetical protein JRH11_23620 [Deltaproteobacteria bacterium]|nr:hypothetical protein [Deltaproteobacteria bacterium]
MRTNLLGGALIAFALVLLNACGGGSASLSAGAMPPGGSYSGVFFSPQYGEMNLVQNGNAVVGEYRKDERSGRIQGTVQGDLMRFEWTEERALVGGLPQTTRGRGYFRYSIDESDKHNILGEWGIDEDEIGGGVWNGYKLNRRRPQLSTDTAGGAADDNPDWDDTGEGAGGGDDWDDNGSGGGGGGGGGGADDPGGSLDGLDL